MWCRFGGAESEARRGKAKQSKAMQCNAMQCNVEPLTRRGCSPARQVIQTRCVPARRSLRRVLSNRCVGHNAPERMVIRTHTDVFAAHVTARMRRAVRHDLSTLRATGGPAISSAGGSRQTHSLGSSPVITTQRVNLLGNFCWCLTHALAVQIVGEGFHDIRARTCALAAGRHR